MKNFRLFFNRKLIVFVAILLQPFISYSDPAQKLRKVALVGDVQVGKTTLIKRLIGGIVFENYIPTVGFDFFDYQTDCGKIKFLDMGGRDESIKNSLSRIKSSNIVFLVYDITNKHSFAKIQNFWRNWLDNEEEKTLVLIGNKKDLKNKREVTYIDGEAFAEDNNMHFFEVSARTEEGLVCVMNFLKPDNLKLNNWSENFILFLSEKCC